MPASLRSDLVFVLARNAVRVPAGIIVRHRRNTHTDHRPSVDFACFFGHDSPGEKHVNCAEACARVGNPLAIFDGKQIYLSVSMHHKNPNDKLRTCIEKKVKLTGSIVEKAGLKGIMIEKVGAAE